MADQPPSSPALEDITHNSQLTTYNFPFGPFHLDSDLDIPPLRRAANPDPNPDSPIPVSVRLGEVPPQLPNATVYDEFCQVAAHAYLLDVPGVARFLVQNGSSVTVHLAPEAPPMDVCSFLLGSVFGALCHQNGILPLHAGAVEHAGHVTAFLGDSGAGKSTLVACLQARGRRVVADDICVLAPDDRVVPVAGWIKLWRQSFDHLGAQPDERNRIFLSDDKYRLYLDPTSATRPTLKNIILLTRAPSAGRSPLLEPLTPSETIAAMMEKTYLAYVVELTGTQPALFQTCARLLAHAKGYRLIVPWGLENMPAVLDLLDRDLF